MNDYTNLNNIDLTKLGFGSPIDIYNCWIANDHYHFKWVAKNGAFHASASSHHRKVQFDDIMRLRMDMGVVSKTISDWFYQHWDSQKGKPDDYSPDNSYGTFEIEPYNDEYINITVSISFYREYFK